MPIELIELDYERRVMHPGDTGFLFTLKKGKRSRDMEWPDMYSRNYVSEAVKWLRSYAVSYYQQKCPESIVKQNMPESMKTEMNEGENTETEETKHNTEETEPQDNDQTDMEDIKSENVENTNVENIEKAVNEETNNLNEEKKHVITQAYDTGILFMERDLVYDDFFFIASNLPDPGDYLHFVLNDMAEKQLKTKYPYRVLPIHSTTHNKASAVEENITPFLREYMGQDDQSYRFSIVMRGQEGDFRGMTFAEIAALLRNCLWSINPNCIQCIKFQDFAIVVEILDPIICVGICKDFNAFWAYHTDNIANGRDLKDQEEDSEDDLSDDPTLDDAEDRKRKLRIKKKRRAEHAAANEGSKKAKVEEENVDEEQEEDEAYENGGEQNEGEEEDIGEEESTQ